MAESDRLAQDVRNKLAKLNQLAIERCSGPDCPETRAGMAFGRGERVLDRVTGQEGVIYGGSTVQNLFTDTER